jgi:ABC-2 type transport system ATP-binding protein
LFALMLELSSLTKTFPNGVRALDDLSFDVPEGSVFGFLGANGAGKTTAMRAIFGLTTLDDGVVRWRGKPVGFDDRRHFGYMPEERGLYPDMATAPQLSYLAQLHGVDAAAADRRAAEWLDRLGLGDRGDDRVEELSMGNQQRIQLISALIHEPQLIVLDEPFSGLDPTGVEAMSDVLRDAAAGGTTVLFSSHQLDLVEDICESVAIIDQGALVVEGAVRDLQLEGAARFRVAVAGDAAAAWAEGVGPEFTLDEVEAGVATFTLSEGADDQALLDAARAAGPVELFARRTRTLSEVFRDSQKFAAAGSRS